MGQSTVAASRARARRRNREHLKRSTASDITAGQELAIRRKARNCPLCGILMRSEGGKPDSKELDHIIPIAIGGTHTHGNVRIVCRHCNQCRPKDGSDYSGPVTLWAQGPSPVRRPRKQRVGNVATCRKGLHPWVTSNIETRPDGKKRCRTCDKEGRQNRDRQQVARQQCKCGMMFAAPGRTLMCPACTDTAARKAAELHKGGIPWNQVAVQIGYSSGEGARYAAKRIGYTPARVTAAQPQATLCQCGSSAYRHGRCRECITSLAQKAAAMYAAGETLRRIGRELGYGSPTSVSNLIKSVSDVRMRVGRPGWRNDAISA